MHTVVKSTQTLPPSVLILFGPVWWFGRQKIKTHVPSGEPGGETNATNLDNGGRMSFLASEKKRIFFSIIENSEQIKLKLNETDTLRSVERAEKSWK